eukprot:NODE_244_length_13037_cov_0.560442.p6 type:complete len:224 gc:universal NODE_244_length_13037_cov_0.560442:12492-11821(-)
MGKSFKNIVQKSDFETGRYLLIVSLNCPFAARASATRFIKNLVDSIPLQVVHPVKLPEGGWKFDSSSSFELTTPDKYGRKTLKEYYLESDPEYNGVISVPVLYDTKTRKIVNNESIDLIRVFNDIGTGPELFPSDLKTRMEAANALTGTLGGNAFKTSTVQSKQEYDVLVHEIHKTLKEMDDLLKESKYLAGDVLTESDIRIMTWLYPNDDVMQNRLKFFSLT